MVNQLTYKCRGVGSFEAIGLYIPHLGIQLHSQIYVFSPSRMCLISPCLNTSIPSQLALHVLDGLFPICALRMSFEGK
jgi:hypothetical protein